MSKRHIRKSRPCSPSNRLPPGDAQGVITAFVEIEFIGETRDVWRTAGAGEGNRRSRCRRDAGDSGVTERGQPFQDALLQTI